MYKITDLLQNKNSSDRSRIKGVEISKIKKVEKTDRQNYKIEIVDINALPNGVEVFARAWNKNDEQIGFGVDGTVDIERFIIINPPILVPDVNGDIIRTQEANEELGIPSFEARYREDPQEAMLQVIEHNLSVMKNIHDDSRIVKGKVGNTTSTFYPDANTETTTVDSDVGRVSVSESWSTIRGGAGNAANPSLSAVTAAGYRRSTTVGSEWRNLLRFICLFDTSSIPDTDDISSATLSMYVTSHREQIEGTIDYYIVDSSPASNTNVVSSDYANVGTTKQSSLLEGSTMTSSAYNAWTLNATGLASISKTGVTKFGIKADNDITNTEPTGGGLGDGEDFNASTADETGTTQDPKLVVEHAEPVTINSNFFMFM